MRRPRRAASRLGVLWIESDLLLRSCGASSWHWCEQSLKYEVPDVPSLGDAFSFIEAPVDAEIDSALTVFFLGLG